MTQPCFLAHCIYYANHFVLSVNYSKTLKVFIVSNKLKLALKSYLELGEIKVFAENILDIFATV